MQRFIHLENIRHYKRLLERTADATERARILQLMAEEEAREQAPAPQPTTKAG